MKSILFAPLSYKALKQLLSAAVLLMLLLMAKINAATTDLAAFGVGGWSTIPVASSNGDGTFTVTNFGINAFPGWVSTPGVEVVTGDFNGDGRTDLAAFGVGGARGLAFRRSSATDAVALMTGQ